MPNRYDTDYELGQNNIRPFGMDLHNPVFVISSLLVLLFVIGTLIFLGEAKQAFDGSKAWSINNFDWLFLVAGALLFGGGADALGALQAAAITVGLPFTLVLLAMCVALYMGLSHERRFVLKPKAGAAKAETFVGG